MIWLTAGIIPPILWALVNHTDKYLLSKTYHHSSVNVLMIYSTFFSLILLPGIYFFTGSDLFVNLGQVIVQIVGGILLTISIYFYLLALDKEEASIVMPLALLVPIFGYLFSYILLGEVLTAKQLLACAIVLAGALILSLGFNEEGRFRLKHGVVLMMAGCTAAQAAQETLFKTVTIDNSFVVSLFWLHVGIAICGFILLATHKNLWSHFMDSVYLNGKLVFGVNVISEFVNAVAYAVRNYAIMLAPIAVIMTLNGYQPVFVFIFGIILTLVAPKFVKEKIKAIHLFHKGIAITIMVIGTVIISQTL